MQNNTCIINYVAMSCASNPSLSARFPPPNSNHKTIEDQGVRGPGGEG